VSKAAEDYVDACAHPAVREAARTVFKAIACLIPEGQTTTPFTGMGDLASQARPRLHRRTVVKRIQDLVAIGEIKVLDGGQGLKARYTIVHLDGEQPIMEAPLPLRADLRPVADRQRSRRPVDDLTPSLFDEPAVPIEREQPAKNLWRWITCWRRVLVIFDHMWAPWRRVHVIFDHMSITGTPKHVIQDHMLAPPLGVDSRARDVHTFKNVHTHAAPSEEPPNAAEERPSPIVHPWHAWCRPLVCVPKTLHEDWRRKHPEAWLFAFYARTYAATPVEQLRLVVDEFKFWRAALAAEFTPQASANAPPPAPDLQARAIEERRQRQGSGFS
jgi:hypothetical protein